MKRYLIRVWGCVEPYAHGPYKSSEQRDKRAKVIHRKMREEDILFGADINDDGGLEVWSYPGYFFEED